MSKLTLPRLPDFKLSQQAIENALRMPITKRVRRELVLPEDEQKPNHWNRIVATGLAQFNQETGIPEAVLIRWLLIRYFAGSIEIDDTTSREYMQINPDVVDTYGGGYENTEDEFIEDDSFDFPGG